MTVELDMSVTVDVQEAFDELKSKDQRELMKDNFPALNDEDLIEELQKRGYII